MSPSSQERVFEKAYAAELLRIAQMDLKTSEFLLEGLAQGRIRAENFFFSIQQCVEKTLKACLIHLELPVPLVHDLGVLLRSCLEHGASFRLRDRGIVGVRGCSPLRGSFHAVGTG